MSNTIIFTGVVKAKPDCGISMKNFFFIKKFQEYYDRVIVVGLNFVSWHKYLFPFRILKLLYQSLLHRESKIVVSSNTWESNIIFKILAVFKLSNRCYYWVPGGVFHNIVQTRFELSTFKQLNKLYVQSPTIVRGLEELGFSNAIYVPNSKEINYLPHKSPSNGNIVRFVFLSRVHPDKGCRMIINCAKRLNSLGYSDNYLVDFYGKIYADFKDEFMTLCNEVPNVEYKGYMNLTKQEGYDRLASYDIMLFPTNWWGEGFPGVVIDAYIAGLPIIASDWNCNCDVIDQSTGFIIPAKNEDELFEKMKNTIEGKYNLLELSRNCQKKAKQYDNEYVLSETNLKRIGLL